MNVSFLKDDPLESVVVDSSDGRSLYEVRTPQWKLTGRSTTILRSTPSSAGEIVAEIKWHSWSPVEITFLGTEMRMDDFLRKSRILSVSKLLTGADGREYKWKESWGKLLLIDHQTNAIVAESHRRKLGLISSQPRKMNLDILPQGIHSIDIILVSFIIMEANRRERDLQAAGAS